MFPQLKSEERAVAAENYSAYLRTVATIYDELKEKGKLKDVLLRSQYEKRNRNKRAPQNVNKPGDDTATTGQDSNGSAA